jgi:hypothetical protein
VLTTRIITALIAFAICLFAIIVALAIVDRDEFTVDDCANAGMAAIKTVDGIKCVANGVAV